ncbi:TAXI family TRAP transporter solute-binding subunit [Arenibacterium sp. LLYu02]|uniref:TAXI family TRAP transporter solute-binding subunit n=1 Tax=Arenibacterium sp. LLYu02 TaxID=3404132 RepID=UPI003B20D112
MARTTWRSMRGMLTGFAFAVSAVSASASEDFIVIGTGSEAGLYYPMGNAICRLLNKDRGRHGIRCSAEPSGGSIDNLAALREGRIDFALVQSDWQARAFEGRADFVDGTAFEDLRAVFSLYPEVFTVVARADSDIVSFGDLRGKRVNIGNPGSGQRATMEVVMTTLGWTKDSFSAVSELPSSTQAAALCAGEFDAMVFAVGHPASSVQEATTACDSRIIPVDEPEIAALISSGQIYSYAEVPGGLYRGNDAAVPSFGFTATLVTTRQQSLKVVQEMVQAVFTQIYVLQQAHPAFASLDPVRMVNEGLTAPLHRATRAFYRFEGLLGDVDK